MNLRQDIVVDKIGFIMPTKIVVGEGLFKASVEGINIDAGHTREKQKPIC